MATPKFADYLAGTATSAPGGIALDMNMRVLAALAALASGQNPDGTNLPPASMPSADSILLGSSTGAAGAISATLTSAAGRLAYITGFEVTGSGATSATVVTVTVTGLSTTLNYTLTVPAGATTAIQPLLIEFANPIPASAVNTNIVVNVPSFGTGNTNAAVTAHGILV